MCQLPEILILGSHQCTISAMKVLQLLYGEMLRKVRGALQHYSFTVILQRRRRLLLHIVSQLPSAEGKQR